MRWRLRLSTLLLLLIILAEAFALGRERQRVAKLEGMVRNLQGQYDEAIRRALERKFDPFLDFKPKYDPSLPNQRPTISDLLRYCSKDVSHRDGGLLGQGFIIGFDSQGISEARASVDAPITLPSTWRKSRGQVLEEVLDQANLGFYVKNGVMTITSKVRAERERREHPFEY